MCETVATRNEALQIRKDHGQYVILSGSLWEGGKDLGVRKDVTSKGKVLSCGIFNEVDTSYKDCASQFFGMTPSPWQVHTSDAMKVRR